MNKNDLKDLLQGLRDIHPVLIADAGVLLLCLSLVLPPTYQYMEDNILIAGLACLAYGSVFAIAHQISSYKSNKAKLNAEIQKFNAKRAEFKRNIQNRIK